MIGHSKDRLLPIMLLDMSWFRMTLNVKEKFLNHRTHKTILCYLKIRLVSYKTSMSLVGFLKW